LEKKEMIDLRPNEEDLLKSFEAKQQLIRDRVASVVHRYHTGAYLVGRPGTSKTYTVKEELEGSDVPWVYRNARMTPMGLFEFLAEHPEHIIVLDDISTLFKNDQAVQILLAALDGKPGEPRLVTYKSADVDMRFFFTGAIIAISNVPLRSDPLARALGSRIVVLDHEPSDDEVAAFIRHLPLEGQQGLSIDECIEVSEFVIAETRSNDQRLDLRRLNKAFQDFRQDKDGHSQTSWKDLVRTSLKKLAIEPITVRSKKDDILAQREKVRQVMKATPNDTPAQIKASGLKQSTFYARKKEVLAEATANAA
jgi:hypothetical protein